MALDLPPLPAGQPIATKDGAPSLAFAVYWQRLLKALGDAINTIDTTLTDVIDLNDLITSANAAIAAVDTAVAAAQEATDAVTSANALGTSFVSGATISATDAGASATITISAHTRKYPQPDGSTVDVAVNGGTKTGLAYDTRYFIYYDDPTRAGGAVTYQTSTAEVAQIGDRHVVGSAVTPLAAGAPIAGGTVRPPGTSAISYE